MLALCTAGVLGAQTGAGTLEFALSQEVVPQGATAVIKLFLRTPQPMTSGLARFTFRGGSFSTPSVPSDSPVTAATVFSATGDVSAYSHFNSTLRPFVFEVVFSSPSGGVGRLPELPVLEFAIPVNSGFFASLDVESSWFEGPGGRYTAAAADGGAVPGGTLSVQSISPVGTTGILPAGTVVEIRGTGFKTASNQATVQMDGVRMGTVNVVSDNLIQVTLAAPATLAGKHVRVSTPNSPVPVDLWGGLDTGEYTFPLGGLFSSASTKDMIGGLYPAALVIENPNATAVQVSAIDTASGKTTSLTVPSGGISTMGLTTTLPIQPTYTIQTIGDQPVRAFVVQTQKYTGYLVWARSFTVSNQAPVVGAVVNGASLRSGGVSPGEIVTIFGTGLGPAQGAQLVLDSTGNVAASLSGVRVLFNGVAAPLLYVSASQINAVVPYEISGSGTTQVQVEYNGVRSAAWGMPVAASAPGVFTFNSTGVGAGAVLNQDGSVNSPDNPATRGSVIQIFATGEGMTRPNASTGALTPLGQIHAPMLPVSVSIKGTMAEIEYAGAAPGAVAGLLQVNARVPSQGVAGNAELIVTVGNSGSATGVTVAVQ